MVRAGTWVWTGSGTFLYPTAASAPEEDFCHCGAAAQSEGLGAARALLSPTAPACPQSDLGNDSLVSKPLFPPPGVETSRPVSQATESRNFTRVKGTARTKSVMRALHGGLINN